VKHPVVIPTLLYVAGILLGEWLPLPLAWLFATSFGALLMALGWPRGRGAGLAVLLVAAGWTNQVFRTAVLSPDDLRHLPPEPALVTVRGELVETPYQRVFDRGEEESWRTLAFVKVTALRSPRQAWCPASGVVAASTPGVLGEGFYGGREVEISGVLSPPKVPAVPGQFDYAKHLRRQGIYFQLRSDSAQDWHLAGGPEEAGKPAVADRFTAWAKRTLALGLPVEDEPLRLLWAMTLGWKTALTGEVSLPFMRSGTMHIFAISGLHIALIAGILVALLRVLRVTRGWCGWVVIPLIWCYTGVTGWQPSAIRSSLMMSVVILGWSLHRPWNLLNSLAAAALIILLGDPQQLFQASFQLSFFVVLSLALFAPIFERLTRGWLQPDPLLPAQLRPRWQRALRTSGYWLAGNFSISLAAWVGSLPLIAYYFHLLTPASLIANLLVVPLSGFALMANLGSLAVGWALPGVAELFNHAAWFFMALMIYLSEACAALPGGWFRVGVPTALDFVCYYAVVISVLAGWLWQPRLRGWLATGLALLLAACAWQHAAASAVTHLAVIPLDGGHAVHCRGPEAAAHVLVDCGSQSGFEFTLSPYLSWCGENWLTRLVLTHGDVRQTGGAELLLKEFAPREIVTSSVRFRSPSYRELVEAPAFPRERQRIVQAGDSAGAWQVLHPRADDRFPRADDLAIVLRGELAGTRVLLLSDLGRPGQEALLQRTPAADLRADIVVAGLPVEGEPLSEGLLDIVQPRLIVLADNENPATRRASPRLRERLAQRGVPVLYTREGAVLLALRSGAWTATRADGRPAVAP
jgi:ComEC/Rec2-related protein